MFNKFSNELTAVAFDTVLSDPDAYERLEQVAKKHPATAVEEIRTFVEKRTKGRLSPDSNNRALVEAGLRTVRWSEIRDTLAKS